MSASPSAPNLPAAPDFAGSQIYDEEGNLSGSIVKDDAGNIVYRPKVLTGTEAVNKKAIESTRDKLLNRLNTTPAEYTTAAQQEADAWAAEQSKAAGTQFTKDINRIGEVSNARGIMGSKAYADIIGQREKSQGELGASIAGNALSMRESLIQAKKGQDYNLYNLYRGAGNDYSNKAMANLSAASNLSNAGNQFAQNTYGQQVSALNADYRNRTENWSQNEPWRNYIMPAAQTGAMAAFMLSDRRLKKSITPVFKVNDVQWYEFEYDPAKWPDGALLPQPGKHIGVMADEVRHIPDVVSAEQFYGFDMVDYEALRRYLKMENA